MNLKRSVCIGIVLALLGIAALSPIARAQQDTKSGEKSSTSPAQQDPGSGQASSTGHAQQDPGSQTLLTRETPTALKIAPGDLLHITVFDVPEMTQDVRVGSKGEAQLPLIGNIELAGLTGEEAAEKLANELRNRKLLLRPQVNVLIKEFASQGVSIIGEVQRPGVYQVLGARSLLDLISMAGGLTNMADTRITVKRRRVSEETITTRLKTDDPATSLTNNVQIYPGDLILVPRAGIVYVLGDVNKPGGFVMQDSGRITLLQALAQAGGTSKSASLSKAVLMRRNQDGYETTKLHVGKIEKGEEPDPQLQANDILFVPNNRLKNTLTGAQAMIAAIGSASIYAVVK